MAAKVYRIVTNRPQALWYNYRNSSALTAASLPPPRESSAREALIPASAGMTGEQLLVNE